MLIKLKQFGTGETLFMGDFRNVKEALEDAVSKKVNLSGVEIVGQNLDYANLDHARLDRAYIHQCSLRHCDLSESSLNKARFVDCDLSYACLAYASIRQTSIIETPMAGMELAGAWVENIVFSCPSGLSLAYTDCTQFRNSIYIHNHKTHCLMTQEPILIKGLPYDVTLMSSHIKVGCLVKKYEDMEQLHPDTIHRLFGDQARTFQALYHPFLKTASRLASLGPSHVDRGIDKRHLG